MDLEKGDLYSKPQCPELDEGQIFRELRKSQDEDEWSFWASKLTDTKLRNYRCLESTENAALLSCLDSLLQFPGLWAPFSFGTLCRILPMRCIDELVNYMTLVLNSWSHFTLNDPSLASSVDPETVQTLELLCPKFSLADQRVIERSFETNVVFSSIDNPDIRAEMMKRVREYGHRIPSIGSFLRDTKYWESCLEILSELLGLKIRKRPGPGFQRIGAVGGKRTLRQAFQDCYHGKNFDEHYEELWLFAMRNFPSMIDHTPRKDPSKPKPRMQKRSRTSWREFSCLAKTRGFCSPSIQVLCEEDVDRLAVLDVIKMLRPDIDESQTATTVSSVVELIRPLSNENSLDHGFPQWSNDVEDLSKERRCGRPFEQDLALAKKYLYLKNIKPLIGNSTRTYVGPFVIAYEIFSAFVRYPASHDASYADSSQTLLEVERNQREIVRPENIDTNISEEDRGPQSRRTIQAEDMRCHLEEAVMDPRRTLTSHPEVNAGESEQCRDNGLMGREISEQENARLHGQLAACVGGWHQTLQSCEALRQELWKAKRSCTARVSE